MDKLVSKWLERKIEDIIFGFLPIPYLDEEIVQVAEGYIGVELPGLPHIDLSEMSTSHKILLIIFGAIPVLDVEYLDLVGLDPFKGDEASFHADDTELDPLYDRGSGQINNQGGTGGYRSRGSQSSNSGGLGGIFKKLFLNKFVFLVIPLLVLLVIGVGVASGSGYTDLVANEAGYQLSGVNMPAIGDSVAQAAKTVECVGNVACVREWQFNNTQRPGSEEVGQEYGLDIESFDINDGFPLDVANRRAGDRVPVDFSVYNPRHGLKGVEANNVAYRIGVFDNTGSIISNENCRTGWMPLGGEYADNDFGENGTILPGGFATPLGSHTDLTLKNCELLQPALGIKKRVKLQLAYDYSSQSTIQVQAMSRENMLSLEERPSFKKSQTADTPVKTYVNVESPITYRENGGSAESSVFGLRVGFETGQDELKYRVHTEGFRLYDSAETIDVNSSDDVDSKLITCEDLRREGTDQYNFSSNMTSYLDSRQSGSWFESDSGPSPARCSMVLENPGSISQTGETLTFRIDANYTVLLEEIVGGFEVQNSRCERYECPMLVPDSHEDVEQGNLISECDSSIRLDANNGCGARFGQNWPDVELDYAINNTVDAVIEEGETAYKINELMDVFPTEGYIEESFISNEYVIGLEEQNVQALRSGGRDGFAALLNVESRNNGPDVEYQQIDKILCDEYSKSTFREIWSDKNPGEIIYMNQAPPQACGEESLVDFIAELYTYGLYESPSEEYERVSSECDEGVVVVDRSGMECYN